MIDLIIAVNIKCKEAKKPKKVAIFIKKLNYGNSVNDCAISRKWNSLFKRKLKIVEDCYNLSKYGWDY